MFGALDIYLGACQYYIGIYPNIEDHAEILKAVIGANTSDNEQKIIGSEKTEMIHQNKKRMFVCTCFTSRTNIPIKNVLRFYSRIGRNGYLS